jgi:hypothetical protein
VLLNSFFYLILFSILGTSISQIVKASDRCTAYGDAWYDTKFTIDLKKLPENFKFDPDQGSLMVKPGRKCVLRHKKKMMFFEGNSLQIKSLCSDSIQNKFLDHRPENALLPKSHACEISSFCDEKPYPLNVKFIYKASPRQSHDHKKYYQYYRHIEFNQNALRPFIEFKPAGGSEITGFGYFIRLMPKKYCEVVYLGEKVSVDRITYINDLFYHPLKDSMPEVWDKDNPPGPLEKQITFYCYTKVDQFIAEVFYKLNSEYDPKAKYKRQKNCKIHF